MPCCHAVMLRFKGSSRLTFVWDHHGARWDVGGCGSFLCGDGLSGAPSTQHVPDAGLRFIHNCESSLPTGQVHWKAQVELMDETREAVREFGVTRQWRPWRQNQSGCLADIIDLMVSLCWLGGSAYSPNYLWFERDKVFFVAFTSSSSSPTSATTSEGED